MSEKVKPGYKLTEMGVIPEEWDAPFLGEIFTFKNGLNKAMEFFGYGTPKGSMALRIRFSVVSSFALVPKTTALMSSLTSSSSFI